ncbi:MAG: hypothetical protein KDI18_05030, partial [Gammaproteobacteria bacterium]|nr:hypothetical protein [Gammaproteobacteria bacterium]
MAHRYIARRDIYQFNLLVKFTAVSGQIIVYNCLRYVSYRLASPKIKPIPGSAEKHNCAHLHNRHRISLFSPDIIEPASVHQLPPTLLTLTGLLHLLQLLPTPITAGKFRLH